ncbi:MAG: hypothetical protein EAZ84_10265 [Verrucomicrobia bacterium]|nr:MAG: hypothetical protein EAZ84_10265 [Verrucomicrobiota bacterium]TAE86373.1 MAG: hypothetical protein EAZ82_11430 [Verrucomicrobiota bacterium]TAF24342.1 MAG: hypothetical protein EAZ71_10715 [Verrucomicrobiota bacterium]
MTTTRHPASSVANFKRHHAEAGKACKSARATPRLSSNTKDELPSRTNNSAALNICSTVKQRTQNKREHAATLNDPGSNPSPASISTKSGNATQASGSPSKPANIKAPPGPKTSEIAPDGKNIGSKGLSDRTWPSSKTRTSCACGNFSRSFLRKSSIVGATMTTI